MGIILIKLDLENNLDMSCNDELDRQINASHFISYANKVKVNIAYLCGNVLNKLFKLYCCLFNGRQM